MGCRGLLFKAYFRAKKRPIQAANADSKKKRETKFWLCFRLAHSKTQKFCMCHHNLFLFHKRFVQALLLVWTLSCLKVLRINRCRTSFLKPFFLHRSSIARQAMLGSFNQLQKVHTKGSTSKAAAAREIIRYISTHRRLCVPKLVPACENFFAALGHFFLWIELRH